MGEWRGVTTRGRSSQIDTFKAAWKLLNCQGTLWISSCGLTFLAVPAMEQHISCQPLELHRKIPKARIMFDPQAHVCIGYHLVNSSTPSYFLKNNNVTKPSSISFSTQSHEHTLTLVYHLVNSSITSYFLKNNNVTKRNSTSSSTQSH